MLAKLQRYLRQTNIQLEKKQAKDDIEWLTLSPMTC